MALSLRQPTRRYTRAWITQRFLNRAPEWTRARSFPYSVAQQVSNPIGLEIQDTVKSLIEERYNMFLSTANTYLLDKVFEASLPEGMLFSSVEDADGILSYSVPTVYAIINGSEEAIFQAEDNNIETFWYDCLPTRIEYGEESHAYGDVLSGVLVSNLSTASLGNIILAGHLYVTVSNNSDWQQESKTRVYYSKIILEGTLRKGTEETIEAVPIRYNSTFRTLNQWESISSVTSAYLSDNAVITISPLPFAASSEMDKRNIHVPADGDERMQFVRLGSRSWGSSLVVESFTSSDMDTVRLGYEEQEAVYEMELLDDSENNINLSAVAIWPSTDKVFAISNNTFYIYDMNLPYADVSNLIDASADSRMEIGSNTWNYVRGETAKIWTRLHSFADVPNAVRWTIILPNGNSYYMGLDGSLWPVTADAWIANPEWEYGRWTNQEISITLDQAGTYTFNLECKYYDEQAQQVNIYNTKILLFVAAIQPEQQLSLPTELQNCTDLAFDSDGKLWFYNGANIYLANLFYDYFMVDYDRKKVILREEYSKIRVVL